jgi:hypothetical protein
MIIMIAMILMAIIIPGFIPGAFIIRLTTTGKYKANGDK